MKLRTALTSLWNRFSTLLDRYGAVVPGLMAAVMVLLYFMPETSTALQYDRMSILSGELWRFYTFCFTHWNSTHLIWDVSAFTLIAYLCWEQNSKVSLGLILFGPIATSLTLWLFFIDLHVYRGVSGMTSGLVAALAVFYLRAYKRSLNLMGTAIILVVLSKLIIELHSGRTLMAKYHEVTALIMVYTVGAIMGLLVATISLLRKNKAETLMHKWINGLKDD